MLNSDDKSFSSSINRKVASDCNSPQRVFRSHKDDDSFEVKRKRKNKNDRPKS